MVWIEIDAHKSSLAVAMVDGLGRELAHGEFGNEGRGQRALHAWVARLAPGERRFGIEGTGWLSYALACFLLERGEQVVDVRGTVQDPGRLDAQLAGASGLPRVDNARTPVDVGHVSCPSDRVNAYRFDLSALADELADLRRSSRRPR